MNTFRLPQFDKVNWKDWKTYFVLPFVLVVYAFWKSLESLRTRVWKSDWSAGLTHEVLAIAAGWQAGVNGTAYFGSTLYGVGCGLLTWAYITPLVWLVALRPAYKGVKWCWNHLDWVDKNIVGPLLKLTARAFNWLPGASAGWSNMKDSNWFVSLVSGIAYLTAAVASLRLGWLTQKWVEHSVHVGGFGGFITHEFIVGGSWAAALLIAGSLGRLFWGALSEGDKQGVGAVVSAATTYASWGLLAKLAALIGVSVWAPAAVAYVLLATYGFPLSYLIFASGFWKKVWKKIEPSMDAYASGKETPFRHIYLQSIGIVVALAIAGASCLLCATLGTNLAIAILVPVVALLISYAFTQELIDQEYGNVLVGVLSIIGLGIVAGLQYVHLGFVFGAYGAIVAGIITALLSAVVISLSYCGVEWLANLPGIKVVTNWLGSALPALHKSYIDKVVEPTVKACERVYNSGYLRGEKDAKKVEAAASFRKLTLHGTNGILAWGFSTAALFGVHQLAFAQAYEPWAGYGIAAIVALFSVGLLGRVIFNAGLELSGLLAAAYAGLKVGALVLPAQTLGLYFAGPFGVVVAALTYGLAFPITLIVARALTSWAAPGLNVPLDWINDRAWRMVRGFAKAFEHLFEFVYDLLEPLWKLVGRLWARLVKFTAPLWMAIAGIVAAVWKTCRDMWKSIFG